MHGVRMEGSVIVQFGERYSMVEEILTSVITRHRRTVDPAANIPNLVAWLTWRLEYVNAYLRPF
jgi:hypothetical protein